MRNIAIADRKDWVFSHPVAPPPPTPPSRLRDVLATLPILLLIPALVVPFLFTSAAGPELRIKPADPVAGQRIVIGGTGFDRRESGTIMWVDDDDRTEVAMYSASVQGRFSVKVRVPADIGTGTHELLAISADGVERSTLSIEVAAPTPDPTPEPTPDPTPKPTPDPTPKPTAEPTRDPTPEPTAAPTTAPTAAPTTAPAAPTPTVAPTPAPTTAPTSAPTTAPTAAPTPTPVPTPSATPTASPTPTATPAPTPTPTTAPAAPAAPGSGILLSASDISRLPTSGAAWTALKARADGALGSPLISNQDDNTDQVVLAKALVYARTGGASYRASVLAALKSALGTESGGRTLALGRNLPAYVISADLIALKTYDPSFDTGAFRPWLRALLSKPLDGRTLVSTHEERPNNWGTHAGAARAAIAAYLGDGAELARTAQVFRGYLGDRAAYAGFEYGDLAWQCDATKPVGINPTGCTKNGVNIDGALPEEMRRGGAFVWPPVYTGYAWEGLQGAVLQAELLRVAGYDAWNWSDRALLRATRFLYGRVGWVAEGDDEWQPWLIDRRYGTAYRGPAPARTGKNFGYTDWLVGL